MLLTSASNTISENLALTTTAQGVANQSDAPTQLFVSSATVAETDGVVNFTVQRTGDLNKYVLISYITQDGDGKAGDRYQPTLGQALFAPGQTEQIVSVEIPNNGRFVGDRQFGLVVTFKGESLDPAIMPEPWEVAIGTPDEQIRRWRQPPGTEGESVLFDITSTDSQTALLP